MRKVITPKLRFQVLNRDNFTCQYCGLKATEGVQLQVDHKISVKKGGETTINNLITSCFQCNIGKGKDDIEEINTKLYETKISETIKQHLTIFYTWWNENNLGTIDNNTKALLNMFMGAELGGKTFCTYLDAPWFVITYKTEDLKELEKLFKEGGRYCDDLLSTMETSIGTNLETKGDYIKDSTYGERLLDDDSWNADGICYDNYNYRLNYIISEDLYSKYKEGELKNDFSIKKFSYFFNEISNG